jgi:dTDP-4-dehydrorhamnose reductase
MNLNNALVTGGNGMIGSNINFGFKPISSELDITNVKSIQSYVDKLENISCIIHLAAINLRESEERCVKAINVNINGTTNMLKIAMQRNIPFILLSTGASFSSNYADVAFDELCNTSPNCVYGHTKSASEQIALLYDKTIVIRTGWLFGGNQKSHYKFVETVINNLTTNNEIKASDNFYGSPTYVKDLIERMGYLIENSKYGIHHIVNRGKATGYDIAIEIANRLKKPHSLVIPVNSKNVPNAGPQRSNTEVLESIHLYNHIRSWKEALREYIDKYLNNKKVIINTEMLRETKKWKKRDICRLCDSYNIHPFFNLEPTPPANHFVSDPTINQEVIPLDICICQDCNHIQLLEIVDPVYQYADYFYVSSTSNTMTTHLKQSVMKFSQLLDLRKTDHILEIGANDGVCVKELLDNGFSNIIGVDPASNINKRHKLPIICDFFGSHIVDRLEYKKYKLIFAFHCCAHIENIQDIFKTIYTLMDDDEGTFIMEVGYFYKVFKNKLFDVIYHEHIDYHTVTAMRTFANKFQLTLYKVDENSIQGGSIQFFFCKISLNKEIDCSVDRAIEKEAKIQLFNKNILDKWQNVIIQNGRDINHILNSFVSNGKKIVGYGASAKSTTFLYQFKLSSKTIDYIIDDSIYKQNFYTPGLHIPIKSSNMLDVDKIDYILILSWNFTDEILIKLEAYRKNGLRIIIPFPEIKII